MIYKLITDLHYLFMTKIVCKFFKHKKKLQSMKYLLKEMPPPNTQSKIMAICCMYNIIKNDERIKIGSIYGKN